MIYELSFLESAWKEWNKLDNGVKEPFKKKLAERLENPRVESAQISGMDAGYKIKLKQAGYRLIYQVIDTTVEVQVIAVGKRERNQVYKTALKRILNLD